jgi:hypothetical protein
MLWRERSFDQNNDIQSVITRKHETFTSNVVHRLESSEPKPIEYIIHVYKNSLQVLQWIFKFNFLYPIVRIEELMNYWKSKWNLAELWARA